MIAPESQLSNLVDYTNIHNLSGMHTYTKLYYL